MDVKALVKLLGPKIVSVIEATPEQRFRLYLEELANWRAVASGAKEAPMVSALIEPPAAIRTGNGQGYLVLPSLAARMGFVDRLRALVAGIGYASAPMARHQRLIRQSLERGDDPMTLAETIRTTWVTERGAAVLSQIELAGAIRAGTQGWEEGPINVGPQVPAGSSQRIVDLYNEYRREFSHTPDKQLLRERVSHDVGKAMLSALPDAQFGSGMGKLMALAKGEAEAMFSGKATALQSGVWMMATGVDEPLLPLSNGIKI